MILADLLEEAAEKIRKRARDHECACDEDRGHLPDCLPARLTAAAARLREAKVVAWTCSDGAECCLRSVGSRDGDNDRQVYLPGHTQDVPLYAAPPPAVDVAKWLEERADKIEGVSDAIPCDADCKRQDIAAALALRSAAAAYRREFGGEK